MHNSSKTQTVVHSVGAGRHLMSHASLVCCEERCKEGGGVEETGFFLADQTPHQSYFIGREQIILLPCWLTLYWQRSCQFSGQKLKHFVKSLDGARASFRAINNVEDNCEHRGDKMTVNYIWVQQCVLSVNQHEGQNSSDSAEIAFYIFLHFATDTTSLL